ncbi:MAG TPA: PstS family phosphate ABC transporter substrate-binding protein [Gaiellaceae bacterium]|jgi:phosphate transport system substrate-binding protein|nr:PstS family phosphate ABC transporter substrate-binding protein [Gaiellaceae bacterium]
MKHRLAIAIAAALAVAALAAAAGTASGSKLRGTITADGSSTVGPYATAAAEGFQRKHPSVKITVGISGTGGGFERFCRGETDLSNASRPIKGSEHTKCADAGIKYIAFTVANDGIAIVTNRSNTWAKCLTVEQLKKMWGPGSKVDNWNEVDASFPDVSLKLFGPGTDSGTFDFFTEKINGRARASRTDYFPSEDDNIIVQGVSGERGGLGYFGLSYYTENKSRLNLVKVNSGRGCVAPTIKTVQAKTYKPLSRPLFIYVKRTSFRRAEVRSFLGYILNNERAIARRARFVSLTDAQLELARDKFRGALRR